MPQFRLTQRRLPTAASAPPARRRLRRAIFAREARWCRASSAGSGCPRAPRNGAWSYGSGDAPGAGPGVFAGTERHAGQLGGVRRTPGGGFIERLWLKGQNVEHTRECATRRLEAGRARSGSMDGRRVDVGLVSWTEAWVRQCWRRPIVGARACGSRVVMTHDAADGGAGEARGAGWTRGTGAS